jgi:plastocyanin
VKKLVLNSLLFLLILPISLMANAYGQKALEFKQPLREVSVIVTPEGYYPNQISVFEGERVRFFVTSTVDKPHCFVVDEHKVFLAAEKGKMTEGETLFRRPGKYKFYCPSSQEKGFVTVIEKVKLSPRPEEKKPGRQVASDYTDDPSHWVPKNY